jgi:preprotein translocase SecF subunit
MGLRLIPEKTSYKFVNKRGMCFVFSLIVICGTIYSLATKGLNFGIDFSGGIVIEIQTEKPANLAQIRANIGHGASLQKLEKDTQVLIRLPAHKDKDQSVVVNEVKAKLAEIVEGKIEYRKVDYVGPQVGSELIQNSALALGLSFLAMMIYMWFRFEWQYGVGAVLALVHDAVAVLGFYSLTGLEFDLTSVAAILTVVGYSINDSVVIYDRVRENIRKYKKMSLGDLINLSVNETLSRTINTVLTVILALVALIFFGGDVLKSFSVGMLVGVVFGTYSSVYISAIILTILDPRRAELAKGAQTA